MRWTTVLAVFALAFALGAYRAQPSDLPEGPVAEIVATVGAAPDPLPPPVLILDDTTFYGTIEPERGLGPTGQPLYRARTVWTGRVGWGEPVRIWSPLPASLTVRVIEADVSCVFWTFRGGFATFRLLRRPEGVRVRVEEEGGRDDELFCYRVYRGPGGWG